jgi:predicted nucleic acid-binding protein
MKIFDATVVIAFLSEMRCPDGLEALSKHYEIIIPAEVAAEITRSPGKEMLENLAKRKVVKIVEVDQQITSQVMRESPQLHQGECEAIAYAQTYSGEKKVCIVSDDSKARKIFQKLNFKWTERLLDIMKEKGIIDPVEHASKMKLLQNSPFYSRNRKQ